MVARGLDSVSVMSRGRSKTDERIAYQDGEVRPRLEVGELRLADEVHGPWANAETAADSVFPATDSPDTRATQPCRARRQSPSIVGPAKAPPYLLNFLYFSRFGSTESAPRRRFLSSS